MLIILILKIYDIIKTVLSHLEDAANKEYEIVPLHFPGTESKLSYFREFSHAYF